MNRSEIYRSIDQANELQENATDIVELTQEDIDFLNTFK